MDGKLSFCIVAAALMASLQGCAPSESMPELADRVFSLAKVQYSAMAARLDAAEKPVMPVTFENGRNKDGRLNSWTSGFFPGTLWLIYQYSGDPEFESLARQQTAKLSGIVDMKTHHDIGFQVNCSFGNGYRLTGDESYRPVMEAAALKLSRRFTPTVGCIRSWDPSEKWNYPVIIDNMMNLELLLEVSRMTGDSTLARIACTHADNTLKNHFRPDGSSFHVVTYDEATGAVLSKRTHQGYSDESAWSRGQAWGLYGYTMMFRYTGNPAYLQQARKVAEFIIPMLPEDGVPEWDFNAPKPAMRDSSAGAIIASALVELSTFVSGSEAGLYRKTAEKILRTLAGPGYLAPEGENGNFLLMHGVTNLNAGSGVDIPLTYGDYYFLEALQRYVKL